MAKDTKGHGSNKRGFTFRNHDGSTYQVHAADAAQAQVKAQSAHDQKMADARAAESLGGGHPKSEPVDTHPAFDGKNNLANAHISDRDFLAREHMRKTAADTAAFAAKYGGPKDHARAQRGFNSGKREIARLKRQGK